MRSVLLTFVLLLPAAFSSAATLKGFENQFRTSRPAAAPRATSADADRAVSSASGDDAEFFVKAFLYAIATPFYLSSTLPEEGYSPGLYADSSGDMGEAAAQQRLELSAQQVNSYVKGYTGRWRLDTEKHVGAEAFWTDYIEHGEEDLHYVGASALGDFYRASAWRANYQLGLAALSGAVTRVGPRLAVEAEAYPRKPFFVDALAAVTFVEGGPLGELRAGGGVAWKRAQLRLSWRALIGPFKNLAGPELAFVVRL